jgi:hypothetical protein
MIMPHPLVSQLRFTRSEFMRAVKGVSDADARQRHLPMNCISWNIGHLAWQEQRYLLYFGQGKMLLPEINDQFAYGAPASTPPLKDVLAAWRSITSATDPWLDTLTTAELQQHAFIDGRQTSRIFGNLLQRMIYHYWYHIGENMSIRQMLGHHDLVQFVGNIDRQAPYRPDGPAGKKQVASRRKKN